MNKPNRVLLFWALLLVSLPLFLHAQRPAPSAESILIGPGDELNVELLNTPELTGTVHVSDAGEIRLKTGTIVNVADLSPFQASRAVEQALINARMMNQPHAQVTISRSATRTVSVLGEVKSPGNYDLPTPRPVLDVLAMAGGLDPVLADRNITIERNFTHERVKFDVANNADAALDQRVLVYPGDEILVPKVGLVYVLGDVKAPGAYPIQSNDEVITAVQAMTLAGGPNTTAALAKSVLMRKVNQTYQESRLNLKKMEKGQDKPVLVVAGDIIFVPFSYGRNLAVNGASIIAAASQAAVIRP
jgi:polysaccharide export outer membrane protein